MSLPPSARSRIEPFHVMEIVAAAAAQEARTADVLHLEVGQPGTGAPSAAVARAIELLQSGAALGYTPACGIDALRDRIARLYDERYGRTVDPRNVVVTAGASAAVVLTLLAAFDEGARIAVSEPGYPCYRQIISALGMEPVSVRVGRAEGFLLTAEALDAASAAASGSGGSTPSRIDGVMVASPANPTGTVYDPAILADLAGWCSAHGTRLVADEIYHGITFGDPAPTALDADTVVIGSFSKYFSMTGWRLGWVIVPDELLEPVDRLSQNLYLSPPTLSQHAALAAFDCADELDAHVERYAASRRVMLDALAEMGVTEIAPCDGAFYLYGNVAHWGIDSRELVDVWLTELGVATAPGIDFDPVDGHRWIRWSLAGSGDDVSEAARRLVAWARRQPSAPAGSTDA